MGLRRPNLGALSLLHASQFDEGASVWIDSLDDSFVLRKTNPAALPADGITVVGPASGSPFAGNTTAIWLRQTSPSRRWRYQFNWYIDPSNGSDENDGSVNAPLASFAELNRRLGGEIQNPDGIDIEVMSDVTEPVVLALASPSGVATIFVHASLPAPIYSGTVTAYTAFGPSTGQSSVLGDSGLPVSFTASGLVGRLAIVTAGPRAGVEFFIAKDLGTKTARVSQPISGPFSSTFTPPQVGDSYAVYGDLVKLGANVFPLSFEAQGGPGAQIAFQWLEMGLAGIHHVEHKGGTAFASGCVINGLDIDTDSALGITMFGCRIVSGLRVNGGFATLFAGMSDSAQARTGAEIIAQQHIVQDGGWNIAQLGLLRTIDWIATFDTTVGLSVGIGGVVDLSAAQLWGSGVSTVGVEVAAAGTVVYDSTLPLTQLVTPATQCMIGGAAVAYAALPHVAVNTAKVVEDEPPLVTATRAMFAWLAPDDPLDTDEHQDALLAFCATNDVTTLFLDMYLYLGSSNYSAPHVARMQRFIGLAHAQGLAVHALAGNTDYWDPTVQPWVMTNIVGNIATYNAASTVSERFDGLIYDVAYWSVPVDQAAACQGLCDLVDSSRVALVLPVGVFAPFFLKDNTATRPLILVNGTLAQDGVHLMDTADYVTVGCSRDTAAFNVPDGVDGIIGVFTPWTDYAVTVARDLWANVETTATAPPYTTFFGESAAAMSAQLALVDTGFLSVAEYLGSSVHSYDGWRVMAP